MEDDHELHCAWDEARHPSLPDLPEQVEVGTEEMTAAVISELS